MEYVVVLGVFMGPNTPSTRIDLNRLNMNFWVFSLDQIQPNKTRVGLVQSTSFNFWTREVKPMMCHTFLSFLLF